MIDGDNILAETRCIFQSTWERSFLYFNRKFVKLIGSAISAASINIHTGRICTPQIFPWPLTPVCIQTRITGDWEEWPEDLGRHGTECKLSQHSRAVRGREGGWLCPELCTDQWWKAGIKRYVSFWYDNSTHSSWADYVYQYALAGKQFPNILLYGIFGVVSGTIYLIYTCNSLFKVGILYVYLF